MDPPPPYSPPNASTQSEAAPRLSASLFSKLRMVLRMAKRSSRSLHSGKQFALMAWCNFIQSISYVANQLGQIQSTTFIVIFLFYLGLLIAAQRKHKWTLAMVHKTSIYFEIGFAMFTCFVVFSSISQIGENDVLRMWIVIFLSTTLAFNIQARLIKELYTSIRDEQALHDLIYSIPNLPRY
ncbi:unnamed protein product [Caenorhabditis brenneri]